MSQTCNEARSSDQLESLEYVYSMSLCPVEDKHNCNCDMLCLVSVVSTAKEEASWRILRHTDVTTQEGVSHHWYEWHFESKKDATEAWEALLDSESSFGVLGEPTREGTGIPPWSYTLRPEVESRRAS